MEISCTNCEYDRGAPCQRTQECLWDKGKYQERRGKHGCYYNLFQPRREQMFTHVGGSIGSDAAEKPTMAATATAGRPKTATEVRLREETTRLGPELKQRPKYQPVKGRQFILSDLKESNCSPSEFYTFCSWLDRVTTYGPWANLLNDQVIQYALERPCFINWLMEQGLVEMVYPEVTYHRGQYFKHSLDLYFITAFGAGDYVLAHISNGSYYGPVAHWTGDNQEIPASLFPQIERENFKPVKLHIEEVPEAKPGDPDNHGLPWDQKDYFALKESVKQYIRRTATQLGRSRRAIRMMIRKEDMIPSD